MNTKLENTLVQHLDFLDKKQKETRLKLVYLLLTVFLIGVSAAIFLPVGSLIRDKGILVVMIASPIFGIFFVLYRSICLSYQDIFKELTLKQIFKSKFSNVELVLASKVPETAFKASMLFSTHNVYEGEDRVQADYGPFKLEFSEINVSHYSRLNVKYSYTEKIFRGVFVHVIAKNEKRFCFKIYPKNSKPNLRHPDENLKLESVDKATMEHLGIKEDVPFQIFTDNLVEINTFPLLKLFQLIQNYQKRDSSGVCVSYNQKGFFAAIEFNRNLFEGSIFGDVFDKRDLEQTVDLVDFVKSIAALLRSDEVSGYT